MTTLLGIGTVGSPVAVVTGNVPVGGAAQVPIWSGSAETAPTSFILTEDGDFILLENGGKIGLQR